MKENIQLTPSLLNGASRLSPGATMILIWLLSQAEENVIHEISHKGIKGCWKISDARLNEHVQELEAGGYLRRKPNTTPRGMKGWRGETWTVTTVPGTILSPAKSADLTEEELLTKAGYQACVYLIGDPCGHIKIGKSEHPHKRVAAIKRQGHPDAYLLCYAGLASRTGAFKLEQKLHWMFGPQRLEGEWFLLDADELHAAIGVLSQFKTFVNVNLPQ